MASGSTINFWQEFRTACQNSIGFISGLLPRTTKSGVPVDRDSALSVTPFYAAVRLISETIASLPFDLFKQTNEGSETARRHPVRRVIRDPHPYYGKFNFLKTLIAHTLVSGNGYARIVRDETTMRPVRLEILDPNAVTVELDKMGVLKYQVDARVDGKVERLPFLHTEILHLRGLTWDGMRGRNVLDMHRENLGTSIAATEYGAGFFANGAHISGVIESPVELSPKGRDALEKEWKRKYQGTSKVGTPAILDVGMKFQKVSLSPQEASLVDVRRFSVEEVARMFLLPPPFLGDLQKATFNNMEVLAAQLVNVCLRPIVKQLEEECDRKLLSEKEKMDGTFFHRVNLDGLLRGDTAARQAYYTALFNIGALSSNDIRRLENFNDRTGGEQYFTPLNMSSNQNPGASTNQESPTTATDNGKNQPTPAAGG